MSVMHIRNALANNVSWGKDIILDIIQWRTKTSHRLAFLLAPLDGQYISLLAGFPGLQRWVSVASFLPSLKALALADSLPDSITLASSPIEMTDTTIKAFRLRVEDFSSFLQTTMDYSNWSEKHTFPPSSALPKWN